MENGRDNRHCYRVSKARWAKKVLLKLQGYSKHHSSQERLFLAARTCACNAIVTESVKLV